VESPFTTFRFEILFNVDTPTDGVSNPICSGAFAECEGLGMTMEPRVVQAGGGNDRRVHLPGPTRYGQITLGRGVTANTQRWTWGSADMPETATITECDDSGTAKPGATPIPVDFNPQTLRLTHSALGPAGTQAADGQARAQARTQQHTGSSTDLAMELLFDTSRTGDDVRSKTLQIADLTAAGGAQAAK